MPTPFRFPPQYDEFPVPFTGTKTLDGRVYRFRWWPNVRANDGRGAFFVDLYNVLAQPIVLGWKVVITDDMFAAFRGTVEDIPPGKIIVRRTDGIDDDPAIYDTSVHGYRARLQTLGSPNVVVEYKTLAEVEAEAGADLSATG